MPERVGLMDCGDAVRRADNGCIGKGPVAKTTSYTVKAMDTGTIFTNAGAAGAVTFTLPAPKKGAWFMFLKRAAQDVVIQATGGAKINGGTANKAFENTTGGDIFNNVKIFSDGTDWLVESSTGTWANNNT